MKYAQLIWLLILGIVTNHAFAATSTYEGNTMSNQIIKQYYDAILEQSVPNFLNLLSEDVVHEINQGDTEVGKSKFKTFMEQQFSYGEIEINDLIILSSQDGKYGFSRYLCSGKHVKNVEGYPPATGQHWKIPVVTYFTINNNKISHVAVYYNQKDWINQVS